jgi:Putative Ig domain/Beta-propeller repeat
MIRAILLTGICLAIVGGIPAGESGSASVRDVSIRPDSGDGCPGNAPAATGVPIRIAVVFEPNLGQAHPTIDFVARFRGYTALLGRRDIHLACRGDRLALRWVGIAPESSASPFGVLPGRSHYLRGSDPKKWVREVPHFSGLTYQDARRNVDLEYREWEGDLRFDLVLQPGSNPSKVGFETRGAGSPTLAPDGSLRLKGDAGEFTLSAPVCWQEIAGRRIPVVGRYCLSTSRRVGFALGSYDPRHAVVIDPTISYTTFLGGALIEDMPNGLVVDGNGNVFAAGQTLSTDFPTTVGSFCSNDPKEEKRDLFLAKLDTTGAKLVFATYLGGEDGNSGLMDLAVDEAGCPYVLGTTSAGDFPTTSGAYETVKDPPFGGYVGSLTKLNASGSSLVYSTFLNYTTPRSMAVDGDGHAYVLAGIYDGLTVMKIKKDGSGKVYQTDWEIKSGDSISTRDLVLDDSGNVYFAGKTDWAAFPATSGVYQTSVKADYDGFLGKLDASGDLVWATLMGGSGHDAISGIGLDFFGRITVCGYTGSTDFPLTSGAFQSTLGSSVGTGFIARFSADGSSLQYSTLLGGTGLTTLNSVAVHLSGAAYATGSTAASDHPTKNPIQSASGGSNDAILVKVDPLGQVQMSSYLGGTGYDLGYRVAMRPDGTTTVLGRTYSSDFPVTSGSLQTTIAGNADAFILTLKDSLGTPSSSFQITTATLPNWTAGETFSQTLSITGGEAPFTWSVAAGELPPGLALSSSGVVWGSPSQTGTWRFTLALVDKNYLLAWHEYVVVVAEPPSISTSSATDWTITRAYDETFTVDDGTGTMTWSLDSGALPTGLGLSAVGRIKGTPAETGSFGFTVGVVDEAGATDTRAFTVVINDTPQITSSELPAWTEKRPYSAEIPTADGTRPYTWSVVSGDLPVNGTVGADTGVLSGNAATPGTYSFTVRLVDHAGASAQGTVTVEINPWPVILTDTMPLAAASRPYVSHIEVDGGTPERTWTTLTGSLPSGVVLEATTGALTATRMPASDFGFECEHKDASGAVVRKRLSVTVVPRFGLAEKKNRQEFLVIPGDDKPDIFFLELLGQGELGFKLKLIEGEELSAEISLLDAAEQPIDLTPYLSVKSKSMKAKAIPIPVTGRYFLIVDVTAGFGGAVVRLDVGAEAPKTIKGVGVITSGESLEVTVPVLTGSTVGATVAAAKKSPAMPGMESLTDAMGIDALVSAKIKEKSSKVTVKVKVPMAGGDATATLIGREASAGSITWKFKVARPKLYDLDLPTVPSGW